MKWIKELLARVPVSRQQVSTRRTEPINVSNSATVSSIQSALRMAESGDVRQLFALYRDIIGGGTHAQSEFAKRKMALLGETLSLQPARKGVPEDLVAADACRWMIDECENWENGLIHLMDSVLYPLAVAEKVFEPVEAGAAVPDGMPRMQYRLRRLEPVNHALLCLKDRVQDLRASAAAPAGDVWEPGVRFWGTNAAGEIQWTLDAAYQADPARHIIHRGHILVGFPDCWGGPMRAILFWWLLSVLAQEWFGRYMERFGAPWPVAKTDSTNQEMVNFLKDALSLSTKVGGLVVDHQTQVELLAAATQGGADAYERFHGLCNREISKLVVGQTLSGEAQPTGLGSSVGKLHGEVREDLRQFDQMTLGGTLRRQLFTQFLAINGITGTPPRLIWGGESGDQAQTTANVLVSLSQAGLEPADEAIETISEKVGFPVQRQAAPAAPVMPEGKIQKEVSTTDGTESTEEELKTLSMRIRALSAQSSVADQVGVPPTWLNPLQKFFRDLSRKAESKTMSNDELLRVVELSVRQLPEVFGDMDINALAKVFETGMGEAVVDEVRDGIRRQKQ